MSLQLSSDILRDNSLLRDVGSSLKAATIQYLEEVNHVV
jgi:hypothetical protein